MSAMLSLDLPPTLEKRLWRVVKDSYQGDLQTAFRAFLHLHEKYGWKEQLQMDVLAVRAEVRRQGGVTEKKIADAVTQYGIKIKTS